MRRTALVTGGTKNIGLAVVKELLAHDHRVVVNGRDHRAVAAVVNSLREQGADVLGAVADVGDEQSVRRMVAEIHDEWGGIDIVVNNAGLRCHGPLESTSLEDWNAVLGTVLTGSFLVIRETLGEMKARGWGRIVNVAGLSAQIGAAGRVPVVAAKSGLIGLTKAAAHEGAGFGVTANAISPGFIDTDRSPTLGDESIAAELYQRTADVPVGRRGAPEDIARACAFLCDEGADYITGQVLSVNGGAFM